MKKSVLMPGIILLALIACSDNKNTEGSADNGQNSSQPVTSKHSEAFNNSVSNFLTAYYSMIEGFVNWDTAVVKKESASFKTALDSFKVDELKTDSVLYADATRIWNVAKAETQAIVGDNDLAEQRGSLNILSQALYDLLNKIQYDKAKVYYQECPMAFNDENIGNWLSSQSAIRNPYLGTSHPKYHSGMLKCGDTKDSVNFVSR